MGTKSRPDTALRRAMSRCRRCPNVPADRGRSSLGRSATQTKDENRRVPGTAAGGAAVRRVQRENRCERCEVTHGCYSGRDLMFVLLGARLRSRGQRRAASGCRYRRRSGSGIARTCASVASSIRSRWCNGGSSGRKLLEIHTGSTIRRLIGGNDLDDIGTHRLRE